jgi:hypothetical protein
MKTKTIKPPSVKELAEWDCTKGLHPFHAQQAMREADEMRYNEHLKGIFDNGDPNNPKYNNGYNYATGQYVNIFGYDQDEFMAKQYK